MRTAGRILAGLFFGAVMFVGLAGAANAQTTPTGPSTPTCPSGGSGGTNPNCTTTTLATTTTVAHTTTTSSGAAGTTLPHTGIDMWVPITVGGAALGVMIAARRVLRSAA